MLVSRDGGNLPLSGTVGGKFYWLPPDKENTVPNVTLFGKTRLNENNVVLFFHFNALFIVENALKNISIAL